MIYYRGMILFLLIFFFTDYSHFMDRITLPSTDTARGKGKWKIITA
ncbi:TonB-dependent receptor [Escherichia coli]